MSEPTTQEDRARAHTEHSFQRDAATCRECLAWVAGEAESPCEAGAAQRIPALAEAFRDHRLAAVKAERERCESAIGQLKVTPTHNLLTGEMLVGREVVDSIRRIIRNEG